MKDCVFLLADGQMVAIFQSFLQQPRFHDRLGTASFSYTLLDAGCVPRATAPRNDPGVYHRAHELLRGPRATHRRAVVVLDLQWGHALTTEDIQSSIRANLCRCGWLEADVAVIVIEPELEAWVWQDHPLIDEVFYRNRSKAERAALPALRQWLREQGLWPAACAKPPDPKLAVTRARQAFGAGAPVAIYTSICSRVSPQRCQDAAFLALRSTLQGWFPRQEE